MNPADKAPTVQFRIGVNSFPVAGNPEMTVHLWVQALAVSPACCNGTALHALENQMRAHMVATHNRAVYESVPCKN